MKKKFMPVIINNVKKQTQNRQNKDPWRNICRKVAEWVSLRVKKGNKCLLFAYETVR